jgi:hypothetical protein
MARPHLGLQGLPLCKRLAPPRFQLGLVGALLLLLPAPSLLQDRLLATASRGAGAGAATACVAAALGLGLGHLTPTPKQVTIASLHALLKPRVSGQKQSTQEHKGRKVEAGGGREKHPGPPNTARPDEDKVSSPSLARRRERARARVREGRDYKVVPK